MHVLDELAMVRSLLDFFMQAGYEPLLAHPPRCLSYCLFGR